MKPIKIANNYVFVWVLLIASVSAYAQSLSPQSFVQIDIAAREITLDGMNARVILLSSGSVTQEEELALDQANQQAVTDMYRTYGTTANAHTLYSTHNAQAITNWLEQNPEWQAHYDDIAAEFESLSAQLDGLRGEVE